MRIFIATDAWRPQVNGVVRTYENLKRELESQGHTVDILSPLDFPTVPCPGYREIRLALARRAVVANVLKHGDYDHVHVATEGPIGWATRSVCINAKVRFTTAFHTRFPEYIEAYTGLPAWLGYAVQKHFHAASLATLVATPSLKDDLARRGFERLMLWPRGVDTSQFRPLPPAERHARGKTSEPAFLYVGRVSREKNVTGFLDLDLPGRKIVVGEGPLLASLSKRYPDALFEGAKCGEALSLAYASADVFVFPSRTDTFGLVLLEAMASGLPIAAFPVTGPIDIVTEGLTGRLSEDLQAAALAALSLDRSLIRSQSLRQDWSRVADVFLDNILEARSAAGFGVRLTKCKPASLRVKPSARPVT